MKAILNAFLFVFLLSGWLANSSQPVFASSKEPNEIYFFYSLTCPHCKQEESFLEKLEEKYPVLKVNKLEVSKEENVKLLIDFYNRYQVPEEEQGLVPVIFIGEKYLSGYKSDEITGKEIENCVKVLLGQSDASCEQPNSQSEIRENIVLPLIGEINLAKLSPMALATVLGSLDGFNPCAMTALCFLLAVLISTKDRKTVFLVGATFILVSGIVYFLFISVWLNLFLILSNIKILTTIIGLGIIFFSGLMLKEYVYGIVCKLCQTDPKKQDFFSKMETKLFQIMERLLRGDLVLLPLLLGVGAVAAGINLVELACSFGFPMAFTKTLSGLNLSAFSYYFHILVYTLFYMLDDFIIFVVALITLKITSASGKYLKIVKLISAIVLLLLGLMILINPQSLTIIG